MLCRPELLDALARFRLYSMIGLDGGQIQRGMGTASFKCRWSVRPSSTMKRLFTQIEKPQTLQFPIFPEHYRPRANAEKSQRKDDGLSGRLL